MRILRWIINIPRPRVVCVEFGNEFQVNSKWARPSCIPTDLGEIFSSQRRVSVLYRCPENQQQQPCVVSGERLAWSSGHCLGTTELSWSRPGSPGLSSDQTQSPSSGPGVQTSVISECSDTGQLCHYTRVKSDPRQHANTQWHHRGVLCDAKSCLIAEMRRKSVIRDEWFLMVWVLEHHASSLLSIILSSDATTSSVGLKILILFNIFLRKNGPAQQIWTTAGNDIYWLITLEFLL